MFMPSFKRNLLKVELKEWSVLGKQGFMLSSGKKKRSVEMEDLKRRHCWDTV